MAISERHCRSVRAIEKRHAPPICHCEERSDVAISGWHPRSVPAAVKTVLAPRLVIARRPEADVAISGRHCRSERAIVKTVRTPDLSLRGAKRRGNLGKALPFSTSHRKTACTPDLSLRGAKRRGNLGMAPPIRTGRR